MILARSRSLPAISQTFQQNNLFLTRLWVEHNEKGARGRVHAQYMHKKKALKRWVRVQIDGKTLLYRARSSNMQSTSNSHPLGVNARPIWRKIYPTLYRSESHPLSVNLAAALPSTARRIKTRSSRGHMVSRRDFGDSMLIFFIVCRSESLSRMRNTEKRSFWA